SPERHSSRQRGRRLSQRGRDQAGQRPRLSFQPLVEALEDRTVLSAPGVSLVSANLVGTSGDFISSNGSVSADGRYVAFESFADDSVTNDTIGLSDDVFVRDLQTGTTTLVSLNSQGTGGGFGSSYNPIISADGRFVAFESSATDLVPNDTNNN